jgi:hypothetical protein
MRRPRLLSPILCFFHKSHINGETPEVLPWISGVSSVPGLSPRVNNIPIFRREPAGILYRKKDFLISAVLAEHQIGIFAVSTYNTDYVFTKRDAFPRAVSLLKEKGYRIVPESPHV